MVVLYVPSDSQIHVFHGVHCVWCLVAAFRGMEVPELLMMLPNARRGGAFARKKIG